MPGDRLLARLYRGLVRSGHLFVDTLKYSLPLLIFFFRFLEWCGVHMDPCCVFVLLCFFLLLLLLFFFLFFSSLSSIFILLFSFLQLLRVFLSSSLLPAINNPRYYLEPRPDAEKLPVPPAPPAVPPVRGTRTPGTLPLAATSDGCVQLPADHRVCPICQEVRGDISCL